MSNIANITAVKKMEENSEFNTDYQAILEWAAIDGNTIAEAD
jgi:hypothetical protein